MEPSTDVTWWVLGRSWLGQVAVSPPVLVMIGPGWCRAVGPSGHVHVDSACSRLVIRQTRLGNLRVRDQVTGSRLTIVPGPVADGVPRRRLMTYLPPGAEANGEGPPRDAVGAGLAQLVVGDLGALTRQVADAMVAQGALERGSRRPSRLAVWAVVALTIGIILLPFVIGALLDPRL